jgi:hypothetical protein
MKTEQETFPDHADYSAWLQDEYLRRMVGESRLTPSEVVGKQDSGPPFRQMRRLHK